MWQLEMDGHSLLFSVQACTHTIAYSITLQGKAAVFPSTGQLFSLVWVHSPQHPCLVLPSILSPVHGLSSRTMKLAGSRYVLWAMCHLAHPKQWQHRELKPLPSQLKMWHSWLQVCPLLGRQRRQAGCLLLGKRKQTAEETLLSLEENINVHTAGRAMTGQRTVSPEVQGKPSTCVHWDHKYHDSTFWKICPKESLLLPTLALTLLKSSIHLIISHLRDRESASTHELGIHGWAGYGLCTTALGQSGVLRTGRHEHAVESYRSVKK